MIKSLFDKVGDTSACFSELLSTYENSEDIKNINSHLAGVTGIEIAQRT